MPKAAWNPSTEAMANPEEAVGGADIRTGRKKKVGRCSISAAAEEAISNVNCVARRPDGPKGVKRRRRAEVPASAGGRAAHAVSLEPSNIPRVRPGMGPAVAAEEESQSPAQASSRRKDKPPSKSGRAKPRGGGATAVAQPVDQPAGVRRGAAVAAAEGQETKKRTRKCRRICREEAAVLDAETAADESRRTDAAVSRVTAGCLAAATARPPGGRVSSSDEPRSTRVNISRDENAGR